MAVHVVTYGDTLWLISRTYGVPIANIKELNGLTSDLLMPGLALYIPDHTLPERYYTIKASDTLWQIAQQFNTSIQAIFQANPGIVAQNLSIGRVLRIPTPFRYPMQTLAFVDAFIPTSITDKLNRVADNLTYLAVFTYSVSPNGTLVDADDVSLIQEIKRNNVKPLMVLSNYEEGTFSPELAAQVLQAKIRPGLVDNIVRVLQEKGYAGISLDFEFIPANHRADYTAFIRELKQALGGLILHVNVFSKTADMPTNPFAGAFDYAAIGQVADIVTVLTYDYGYTIGPPDPIAPIWWVNQVVRYAMSLIPPNKLMIAIAFFGYDWITPDTSEVDARAISANEAQIQALRNYSVIQFDPTAQSPYYTYSANNQLRAVWFEDIRSIIAKYRLLESYGLLGVSFWRFRYDFPQNWAYFDKEIDVLA